MQQLDTSLDTPLPTNNKPSQLKILVCYANGGGCSYYRALSPYRKLADLYPDKVSVCFQINPLGVNMQTGQEDPLIHKDHAAFKWADVVLINNISSFGGPYTGRVCNVARQYGKFVHFDTDDLLTDLYDGHRLKGVYLEHKLRDLTVDLYRHSHLVTVTQLKFAERIKEFCGGALAIVKNAIDYNLPCWNLPKVNPNRKGQVRVGWAGGIHHEQDVREFAGVPTMVNQRVGKENVTWNFYGKPPYDANNPQDKWQQDVWANYENIIMKGFKGQKNYGIFPALPPDQYGLMFAYIDLAIAPLEMNPFNDSKSEIKLAECGKYKAPLVASDIGCYNEVIKNGVTGYLLEPRAPKSEWVKILSKVIKEHDHREEMGKNLHKIVIEKFDLNKVCINRLKLYQEVFRLIPEEFKKQMNFNYNWSCSE